MTTSLMPKFGPSLTRGEENEIDFRPYCTRCLRAQSACYCMEVRAFSPSFEIAILQHPRERRNAIGTARMTHLCLGNSRLIPGVSFEENEDVNALLNSKDHYCVVLFPGPSALNISESKEELFRRVAESDLKRKLVIFAIDGTWSQARGMIRKSPRLGALPQISFNPDRLSQYRVRKQPNPLCLSTIEAVYRIIEILEPTPAAENLLHVFNFMVEQQVVCAERGKLREGFIPRKKSI